MNLGLEMGHRKYSLPRPCLFYCIRRLLVATAPNAHASGGAYLVLVPHPWPQIWRPLGGRDQGWTIVCMYVCMYGAAARIAS